MGIEQRFREYGAQPLTHTVVMEALADYAQPHNKIQELERKNILTSVKRGLYVLGPAIDGARPSLFLLANHIYGPSYVSLESALAHWGLIPEQVVSVASMTTGLAKTFRTELGLFRYIKLRLPYYSFGLRMEQIEPQQTVLMASPEKALCDLIIERAGVLLRSIRQTRDFLEEDLRIDSEALRGLNTSAIQSWLPYAPKSSSLQMLVKTLEGL